MNPKSNARSNPHKKQYQKIKRSPRPNERVRNRKSIHYYQKRYIHIAPDDVWCYCIETSGLMYLYNKQDNNRKVEFLEYTYPSAIKNYILVHYYPQPDHETSPKEVPTPD